jgi:hypothetical protein
LELYPFNEEGLRLHRRFDFCFENRLPLNGTTSFLRPFILGSGSNELIPLTNELLVERNAANPEARRFIDSEPMGIEMEQLLLVFSTQKMFTLQPPQWN